VISARDPATMAPDDRMAEVAEILAVGYRRLALARRNPLDLSLRAEAPCPESMDGNAMPGKELLA
jgi:hypothetical protein